MCAHMMGDSSVLNWDGRPKITGSGPFKQKGQRRSHIFPATPELWPTGAGELSDSDP